MAKLYGRMKDEGKSNAVEITRTASTRISAQLETWSGGVRVELDRDGAYRIYTGDKEGERAKCDLLIFEGNIDTGRRCYVGNVYDTEEV